MPKGRSGSIRKRDGALYARVTFLDTKGKRKEKWKRADNRTHAKELINQMLRELDDFGEESLEGDKISFADLADYYEKTYLVPPTYANDRKVAGRRDWKRFRQILNVLREHFGKKRIRSISYSELEHFRTIRLNSTTKRGRQRSITTVHRELALLRRAFNVAVQNGWLIRNPFALGAPLIHSADERHRERILTREEEYRLLAACDGPRAHIQPIVIAALDTGMRIGEILKLKWADIDFDNHLITVRAFNTKTMRERTLAMTPRLTKELSVVYDRSTKDPDTLVFGINSTVKTAFNTARKIARLEDVRLHDLRHTAASRLVQAHIPLSEVGRVLGHTQPSTTYRYVNANVETARRAAEALASFSEAVEDEGEAAMVH